MLPQQATMVKENIRIDTRAHVFDASCAIAPGAQRLMWGSDWPWTQHEDLCSYARTLERLNEWIADADARSAVLRDTPAELFRF